MKEETDRTKRENDAAASPNMTPMIDVVFQLLIFFILAGKFRVPEGRLNAELPCEAPCPHPETVVEEDARITIRNLPAGDADVLVQWGEKHYRGAHLLAQPDGVLKGLRAGRPGLGIVIDAEGSVKFDWIIRALNAAVRAGYEKISFARPVASLPPPHTGKPAG